MLIELHIRDFAIIDALTLRLSAGFNALTGETGAGKSIIVEALGLLLGERGAADLVRTGASRASVEGVFDLQGSPVLRARLDERGVEVEEGIVVLKREVAASGRTRAWINGGTVPASLLAQVGRMLVNLHGQHEAQTLIDAESQRRILDAFAGADAASTRVHDAHRALVDVRAEMADLARRRREAERRADYLRHVAAEIGDAALLPGEDERLDDEARRLEHADEFRTLLGEGAAVLGSDAGVLETLGRLQRAIHGVLKIDPSLARLQELYDSGFYALEELARELEAAEELVELDPERLAEVERRRELVFNLMRKHGPSLSDVIEAGNDARRQLEMLDRAELDSRELTEREAACSAELQVASGELTAMRREASERLAASIEGVLPALGMADGRFEVELPPRDEIGPDGAEDVEFRVTLNLGHDPRPLARVASGGELSRVMLAVKTILARLDDVPSLVFDEVDAGIGGVVGMKVGELLRRIATDRQVFVITHLPQIAVRAHSHILVSKGARGGVTTADVTLLDGEARTTEIARMLGGDPESDLSRAHALELLQAAERADEPAITPSARGKVRGEGKAKGSAGRRRRA